MMEKGSIVRRPAERFLTNGDFATSGVPIVCVTAQEYYDDESDDELLNILPLPASKYRYSKWSELEDTEITSNMLRTPRIRKPPSGFKKDTIWMLEEQERAALAEDGELPDRYQVIPKKKRWGRGKKKDYQNKLENWEQCECVNLSYQDLGHPYQMKEFLKVLRKLIRAEMIELLEDSLSDLSSVCFPRCKYLYLQRNQLKNLKKLPKLTIIEHLSLQQNNITNLNGLEALKQTRLKSLTLKENPVSLQPSYRQSVFDMLPNLLLLDDLPRLPADVSDDIARSCCIT